MKKFITRVIAGFLHLALSVRYKVKYKGLEKISPELLRRGAGTLFLPNHPAIFVDPVLVSLPLYERFQVRPIIVEYMYFDPLVNFVATMMNALPVPNFAHSSNSWKKWRNEKAMAGLAEALQKGDNFLIYPAGRTKKTGYEEVGGASGVHQVLTAVPDANVVLVRTSGLWGSSFSRALTGYSPPMMPTIWEGVKTGLKNLIFFTPKREVTIEFELAGEDFPYQGSRLELNQYLEQWYNQPDAYTALDREADQPGDSLVLVSRKFWKEDLPKIDRKKTQFLQLGEGEVASETREHVYQEIAKLAHKKTEELSDDLALSTDLGLDSIDSAELVSFLASHYNIANVQPDDIDTVGRVVALAAGKVAVKQQKAKQADASKNSWKNAAPKTLAMIPEVRSLPEAFLAQADNMPNNVIAVDGASGQRTYRQLKMRVILLAEQIRKMPGEQIGILLPASIAANVLILAVQLAGKVPVMLNWTVGARHLCSVDDQTEIDVVLSSWKFLDRVENVDFGPFTKRIIVLEDLVKEISRSDKLRAVRQSYWKRAQLIKHFEQKNAKVHKWAVILFTSGSENLPKGVPLTHDNILSNLSSVCRHIDILSSDVVLGMLPPFHTFGFTISGLLPLLSGMRVVYSPDPTDNQQLTFETAQWGITLICAAPAFLRGILNAHSPGQLDSVRMFVTGAEKTPEELYDQVEQLNIPGKIIEGYGITECSPVITANQLNTPSRGVGRPIAHVEVMIVHPETHEILDTEKQGLIVVQGPNVFAGYLRPSDRDPFVRVHHQSWYNTGDLGYLDKEGCLHITGRRKRFVKIGGEMVSLLALEEVMRTESVNRGWVKPSNEELYLAVIEKDRGKGKTLLALATTFSLTLEDANHALHEAGFSNLIRFSDVIEMENIPLMGSGKINYRAMEQGE